MTPASNNDTASPATHRTSIRKRVRTALSGRNHSDTEAVKAAVLREFYRCHPEIALEDILELHVLVSVPETIAADECVKAVLLEVLEYQDRWKTPERSSTVGTDSLPVATTRDR